MTTPTEHRTERYSPWAWAYGVGSVVLLALVIAVLIVIDSPVYNLGAVGILIVLGMASEHFRLKMTTDSSMSLCGLLMVVATAVSGPLAAVAIGVTTSAMLVGRSSRKRSVLPWVFNPAMTGFAGATGALSYLTVGGRVPVGMQLHGIGLVVHVLVPLVVANAMTMVTNFVLLSVMIRLTTRERVWYTLWRMTPATAILYGEYGFLAFLIVVLWGPVGMGVAALVLAALPLLVAQWDMAQIANMHASRSRMMSMFSELMDVHQEGLSGHSQCVADTAMAIASRLHVPPGSMTDLEFAAQLVELDSIATSAEGRPSVPVAIEPVTFLHGASTVLAAEQERWDGSGPRGLSADDIPMTARVVAVARSYWQLQEQLSASQAMRHIEAETGASFDPDCVLALRFLHNQQQSVPVAPQVLDRESA